MGNIKHRLPVLDGKTDKEKISQLSDSLFQLIRELNLGDAEVKPTESTEVVVSNVPNNAPNNSAEIGVIKTSLEKVNSKVSGIEEALDDTTALANQLKSMLDLLIPISGVDTNSNGHKWNYTKWANGELEYWRTFVYKPTEKFSGVILCGGSDKTYPTKFQFNDIPALSVSAYAIETGVELNVKLRGVIDTLATIQVPEVHVNTSDGTEISGLVLTIYARGRTA